MTEESLIHKGHRQRMRDKLLSHGSRVLQSYELLEMLLFYVVPLKNTNPTAKKLMLRFGSLEGVFSASREELCEVEGVGEGIADFLKKVGSLIIDNKSEVVEKPLDDYGEVGEFLVDKLSCEKLPKCVMLLFDNRMHLLDYSEIYELDYSSGAVRPEAFINSAIKKRAAVAITAHNHPFGPLFPTVGDMATNSAVTSALSLAGITHLEHYIICGKKYFGISKQISLSLVQSPELDNFKRSREEKQND
jgi:DNA repair protein RadC